jgi:cytochrome P450
MMKFALHIISGADFGVPFEWEESDDEVWKGHKTSFRHAVEDTLTYIFAITFLPRVVKSLPPFRKVDQVYNEFGTYLDELLEREKNASGERQNLLSALVKNSATTEGNEQGALGDREVIGNAFLFLMAGHETR